MKRLMIVGAGPFGREVLAWLKDVPAAQRTWEVAGFLDPDSAALDGYPCDLPILGEESSLCVSDHDLFICSLGDPVKKLGACRALKSRGAAFATLIHPTATVGPFCTIGEGHPLSRNHPDDERYPGKLRHFESTLDRGSRCHPGGGHHAKLPL